MSFFKRNNAPRREYDPGEIITEQSHGPHHEIENIVAQYTRTGVLLHNETYAGSYGDISNADSYEEALLKVREAEQFYDALPEGIRQEFPTGTAEFLEFINNPDNVEEIEAFGLDTSHLAQPKSKQKAKQPASAPPTEAPPEEPPSD